MLDEIPILRYNTIYMDMFSINPIHLRILVFGGRQWQ